MKRYKTPSVGKMLLRTILNYKHPDTMIGDYEEIYNEIAHDKGLLKAKIWYWYQIFSTIPSFVKNSIYWGFMMLMNYLKIASRVLRNHRFFSFINIFGMAVGMASCVFILLWVQDELSYDRFHKNYDNLFRLTMKLEGRWSSQTPWLLAPTLKNEYPEVQSFTRYRPLSVLISNEEIKFYESAVLVDSDFFKMFTFPFIKGDTGSAFPTIDSVVITERIAFRYFGKENPIGKFLSLNNRTRLSVSGVIKNVPQNSHMQFDLLIPVQRVGEDTLNSWSVASDSYLSLADNASSSIFQEKISGIIMKYDKRADQTVETFIQPLSRIHLYSLEGGGNIIYVYIFSIIAVFVLMLACLNFINLTTARGSTRAQEVGMRKVVGARRSQIIKQFLGESILLSFISLVVAVVLVFLFMPAFNSVTQKSLTFNPGNALFLFLGLIIILLITGIVSGSYPALFLSSFHPVKVLKGSLSTGASKPFLRKFLVVFHFTITIGLIIATSMIIKQLNYIRNKDLGYNRQNIVSLPFIDMSESNYESFKHEIMQSNSVIQVTAASSTPVNANNINPVYWEGRGPDQYEAMRFATVDYDYIKTFEMDVILGRDFSPDMPSDRLNYIVNQEAVKFMKIKDPVGKLFSIWQNEGQIIGVVKNFHSRPLQQEIEPIVFTLNRDWDFRYIFIRIRPDNIQSALHDVESIWKRFAPNYPFSFQFLDETYENYYQSDQRTGQLLEYFTILAILISCMGILGLSAFLAEQRTKEIGVRKVLGASVSNIVYLISKEFVFLLALANVVAWPVAYFIVTRMLNSYAYRTGIALWIFVLAGVMTYLLALMTVSFFAFKAARTNPISSLRYE